MDNLVPEQLSGGMLEQYTAPSGVFDELRDREGVPRPEWKTFLSLLDRVGINELRRRWEQTQQLIRDNGFAYGAYLESTEQMRPWELDVIPVLISHAE